MDLPRNWRKSLIEMDYVLLEQIDEGSFGEVHILHKQDQTKIYAVKAITANGNVTDDEYILAEIRSLLQLKHPHIIPMYDLILRDHFVCIIMEFATLGNLEKYTFKFHPICKESLQRWFGQILSAVVYCHSCYIAHKDINPSNILICDNQCVKLADFGLAVKCHDVNFIPVLCEEYLGQNSYLAPEILNQEPHDAMLTDIWSLGCLLYFMLYGKPAFEGTVSEIVVNQTTVGIQPPSQTSRPKEFEVVLNVIKCLCKVDPMLRVNSDEAFEMWDALM